MSDNVIDLMDLSDKEILSLYGFLYSFEEDKQTPSLFFAHQPSIKGVRETFEQCWFDTNTFFIHHPNTIAIIHTNGCWWYAYQGKEHNLNGPSHNSYGYERYAIDNIILSKEDWEEERKKYLYLLKHPELGGFL